MDLELDFEIENGVLVRYLGDAEELVIPDCITVIGKQAFEEINDLYSVVIPNGVTEIGDHAFCHCYDLVEIEIPETVTRIGEGAFWGCHNLQKIQLPPRLSVIEKETFESCTSIEYVEIPEGVKKIEDKAFEGCDMLDTVKISAGATVCGRPFNECLSLYCIEVEEGNPYLRSIDGNLYSADGETLILYCRDKDEETFIVPEGVKVIGESAFDYTRALKYIAFPESLRIISDEAFYGCAVLSGSCSYSGAVDPSELVFDGMQFPAGLERIGKRAFANCRLMMRVVIPDGINTVARQLFENCYALGEVILPSSIKSIGDSAFTCCNTLEYIELPDGLVSIGKFAFLHCDSLFEISIPRGIGLIEEGAFYQCASLKNIIVPPVNRVRRETFQYCFEAESITLSEGTAYIDDMAFCECSSAVEVRIPASIKAIAEDAFSNCSSIERIFISAKGAGLLPLDLQYKAGAGMVCEYAAGNLSGNARAIWMERIFADPVAWLKALDGNALFYNFVLECDRLSVNDAKEVLEDLTSYECRAMLNGYIHRRSM